MLAFPLVNASKAALNYFRVHIIVKLRLLRESKKKRDIFLILRLGRQANIYLNSKNAPISFIAHVILSIELQYFLIYLTAFR